MSPCNTFRFLAVYATIVICIVGSPVPGLVNQHDQIARGKINEDLETQESITVELKSELKRPNDINNLKLNNVKDDSNSIQGYSEGIKKNTNKNPYETSISTEKSSASYNDAINVDKSTPIPLEADTEAVLETNLNMTLGNVQANHISDVENTSSVSLSDTIKSTSINEQARFSFNKDTNNGNQTDVVTTIDIETPTRATFVDVKEESTKDTQLYNETTYASITNTTTNIAEISIKPTELSSLTNGLAAPTRKKYIVIERKRLTTTTATDEPTTFIYTSTDNIENSFPTNAQQSGTAQGKSEVMIKSETSQGRTSLQDAITSDIPSLEKLKADLLSFSMNNAKNNIDTTTPLVSTGESSTKADLTTLIISTFPSTLNSELLNMVQSKRAGYLDLSAKNITEDEFRLKPNETEPLQGPFEGEAQDESPDEKIDRRMESQSQLAEDAIKEELLKEEMLNDNEEISERHRGEGKNLQIDKSTYVTTINANITQYDEKIMQPPYSVPDDNLSVKPINSDKSKNTALYPVNPNYKPLKKIEVQPAKPFVRDPDDNSWRNESLSSLGIVFKPKNSSKPFTQVLKNKTETEWNNFPEKDRKSEVPDLRVRLEQIAQKRKSKKKKIDSLGNVYYTDYEESSSSEENTTTPQPEDTTPGAVTTTDVSTTHIMIVTPVQNASSTTSTMSILEAIDVPALTTTPSPIEKTQTTHKVLTQKPHKMFNLFDYYETNDDEDITDYLNMAKIDLKKYTVPIHTTFTPYTSPPLPILYTNPMTQYTQERKGTIQYFPPRTTKRPRKHKHNNNGDKINSVTLTDSSKHVLPISYHKLTTPYDSGVYYTNGPDMTRLKVVMRAKDFDRNLYLTTPPLTTLPDEDFGVIGNDGGYNKPNYVIKHYKSYMNEATQEQERGKHRGYPYTEPSGHGAITDYMKPTTVKDKTTVTEDYDYDAVFRKDLLDRFVANFNEKSNRFKSEFPVVYNNSIVHGASYDDKDVAMSRAYFRRPYSNQDYKPLVPEPYDPNCENVTVELSPAYELHYYVPDQEEKQEVETKPINLPVGYRL